MSSIIPFTEDEKELYSRLDFQYFLDQNIERENMSKENILLIKTAYDNTKKKIEIAKKKNKNQYYLFIEGYVRKMHSGGVLPSNFNLNEARSFIIHRYEDYGEDWAYFEEWAKREKKLRFRKTIWKRIVEKGSIIGYILGFIELYKLLLVHSPIIPNLLAPSKNKQEKIIQKDTLKIRYCNLEPRNSPSLAKP